MSTTESVSSDRGRFWTDHRAAPISIASKFINETAAQGRHWPYAVARRAAGPCPWCETRARLPLTTISSVPVAPEMSAVRRRNLKLKRALDIALFGPCTHGPRRCRC